jgi:hypothetical protein
VPPDRKPRQAVMIYVERYTGQGVKPIPPTVGKNGKRELSRQNFDSHVERIDTMRNVKAGASGF